MMREVMDADESLHLVAETRDVVSTLLPGGIPLMTMRASVPGLTKVIISFDNTAAYAANPVVAELTFQLLKSGTIHLDTFDFVSKLEETGAMVSCHTSMDSGIVEFVALDDELTNLLPLLFEMIYEPAFPEDEFERIKTIALQNWKISRQQTHAVARDRFIHSLFPAHPYGTLVTEESIMDIQLTDIQSFHRNHILAGRPKCYMASYNADKATDQLGDIFPGITPSVDGTTEPFSPFLPAVSVDGNTLAVSMSGTVQSSIRMGRQLFNRAHTDYVAGKVTTTILGGYFSSRLMANLREDKGYTYGVGAGIIPMALTGYLSISADIGNAHVSSATDEILKEIGKLRNEPVELEELNTVKQYLAGSSLRDLDGVFSQLSMLSSLNRQGLDLEWMKHYQDALWQISPLDVLAFAQQYFDAGRFISVICGETSKNNM